jgi:hypothetical protein
VLKNDYKTRNLYSNRDKYTTPRFKIILTRKYQRVRMCLLCLVSSYSRFKATVLYVTVYYLNTANVERALYRSCVIALTNTFRVAQMCEAIILAWDTSQIIHVNIEGLQIRTTKCHFTIDVAKALKNGLL